MVVRRTLITIVKSCNHADLRSADLELEYSGRGVTVMCAYPCYVVSNMSKIRKANWSTPTPGHYAVSMLNQLGCVSR